MLRPAILTAIAALVAAAPATATTTAHTRSLRHHETFLIPWRHCESWSEERVVFRMASGTRLEGPTPSRRGQRYSLPVAYRTYVRLTERGVQVKNRSWGPVVMFWSCHPGTVIEKRGGT